MVILPYDTESKSRNVLASPLGEEGHEVAKGCTRVRMIMILDVDVTAEGGIIKLIATSRGNERYEGKNSESYTSRTISAFPPLVAGATTFPSQAGERWVLSNGAMSLQESMERFILSPGWGKVRRSRIRGSRVAANYQNAYHTI